MGYELEDHRERMVRTLTQAGIDYVRTAGWR